MKAFQRILAVLLCLVMSLGMISMVASATTIDTAADGSLTIYKYEKGEGATEIPATGTTQTVPTGNTPLAGVTFTVYQIMTKDQMLTYFNGTDATSLVASSYYTESDGAYTVKNYSGTTVTGTAKETGVDGKVTFDPLTLGVYLVIETAYPDKVTQPVAPFLVSIPLTDPVDENEWIYDVIVYPKNSTSEGSITLIKEGEGNAKLEASFLLQKKNGNTWDDVDTYTTDATTGSVEIADLAHGEYQLIEQSVTAEGYVVDKTPITFEINTSSQVTYTSTTRANVTAVSGNNNKALTLTIVNEKLDVTKTDVSTNKTPGVGGTVNFEVTVEVPTNVTDLTSFSLTDAPTNLEVNEDSVEVANVPTDCYDVDYTGDGFTLTFDHEEMGDYADSILTITYTATVKESAASAGKTKNDVTLNYNDGVRAMTDTATTEEQKYYKIDITKRKDSTTGAVAAGVEFKLYKDAAMTQEVKVTGETGEYVYNPNGAANDDATLTTDENGKLVVSGLPAGTYYLKETKAPEGYNLLSDKITITLGESTANQTHTQTIVNKAGFTLPQTGGIGTLMFIIIGGVLMAGGICLIVPNKKRAI